MANFVCVKCGRQCEHYASPSLIKAQMCSVCFNEEKLANERKEPFNSAPEVGSKDKCRKCGAVLEAGDSTYSQLCSHCWHESKDTMGNMHVDVGLRCLFCNDVIYKDEPKYGIPGTSSNTLECIKCYLKHQKEPVKLSEIDALIRSKQSEDDDTPDDVRKVEPKSVRNIDELLNDLAKKRSMRDTVNKLYSRSELFPKARHCAICEHELDEGICLKTATGAIICESCHYKLYHEEPDEILCPDAEARYDLMPQRALRAIAIVMGEGAIEYGVDNWRTKTDFAKNMNRAAQHWNLALLCDTDHEASVKDHLSHCICRMMMAYETYKEVSE